ncbi:hypothetical protein [Halegenticoccus soli]|uniref:hypothetical protein n=1 Tax=Halegenticoccus soli TaxID=1985678 RepID=UPI000C6D2523|nr:hypothetical protein [Halegenticoccus soli]
MSAEDDLTEAEREALHDLQLALEHVHRGYGALLEYHHQIGRGMDKLDAAESKLREAGHGGLADRLRDKHLPSGAIDDRWTYELVEEFRRGFLADVTDFESEVRDLLADGERHITERRQQRRWRERADGWDDE